ncbi:hypothetical protein PV08_01946 [Exophiala spinifera]|uniref:Uncharacterized protein n=1 Tax=Exophiala spinifera TaxID=91928 RepID=A0A0D1Z126_9EURO|nr:uncharacterized protein PV08_01946 [Exophiala spinifera]KIW21366.1 hypothetical protein PV08_01946 [Exophiala spinifera]
MATAESSQSGHFKSNADSTVWRLPGIDKDSFYAAALYLHAAAENLETKPFWEASDAFPDERNFLDHLANCFARSKLQDARDHVSATAMVRNKERKTITVYIAKNRSDKQYSPPPSGGKETAIRNENEEFAARLMQWFTSLASQHATSGQLHNDKSHVRSDIFRSMCKSSESRLEYYIARIGDADVELLGTTAELDLVGKSRDGWRKVVPLVERCSQYKDEESQLLNLEAEKAELLAAYARDAGNIRRDADFLALVHEVEAPTLENSVKLKGLAQVVKWINYLGRVFSAFDYFPRFCGSEARQGYVFDYVLLASQEDDWYGTAYMQKMQSWTGNLDLAQERRIPIVVNGRASWEISSVQNIMDSVVHESGNKARVHCEMQLLMYFSQTGVEQCLNYFGCSKKSCWLCWQMIRHNSKHSVRGTHRKLYPRWAFPFNFDPSQPAIAEGLTNAYSEMMATIRDLVINQKPVRSMAPYPQSSALITPPRRSGKRHDPLQDSESGIFSSNPVAVEGKRPVAEVPALLLPGTGRIRQVRQLKVHAYKTDVNDVNSLLYTKSLLFQDQGVTLAFQLANLPASFDMVSSFEDFRQRCWLPTTFKEVKLERINENLGDIRTHPDRKTKLVQTVYALWYRSASSLPANPILLELYRSGQGKDPQKFPWRGDVIIHSVQPQKRQYPSALSTDSSDIDAESCLRTLERYFCGIGADLAVRQEASDTDFAESRYSILEIAKESKEMNRMMVEWSKEMNRMMVEWSKEMNRMMVEWSKERENSMVELSKKTENRMVEVYHRALEKLEAMTER